MGENALATRYLVVDENRNVWGDFSCDGLAYEWIDTLKASHPEASYSIVPTKPRSRTEEAQREATLAYNLHDLGISY